MIFLFAWGCILEGKSFPLPSPQRLFKGIPVCSDKIDKALTPPLSALSDEVQNKVKLVDARTFSKKEYFSDEFLNEIKNKTKSENAEHIISNNQIIISFLLKKYHNQILPDTDTIRIFNPINLRDIHPDIDSTYIGNAIFNSFTEFTKDEINNMSIYQIAYRLKESIKSARDINFVKKIACLSDYGEVEIKEDLFKHYPPHSDIDKDIISSNMTHFGDLESLGLGSDIGAILDIGSTAQTGFTMLKEKSGRIVAQVTSMYPFE